MTVPGQRVEHADIEKTPTDARQGMKTGHMRYVLGISLSMAVLLMVVAYVAYF